MPIVKLIERLELAYNAMAFRFEKPRGWEFKPGQSIDLTLLDPSGNRRGRKHARLFDRRRS